MGKLDKNRQETDEGLRIDMPDLPAVKVYTFRGIVQRVETEDGYQLEFEEVDEA
jgi:hypothetical protein